MLKKTRLDFYWVLYPPDENKFLDTEFIPNSTIVIREFEKKKNEMKKLRKTRFY